MLRKRLVAVLIMRKGAVVQSVGFRHTNIIHADPCVAVEHFNRWAVDEIVVLDVSRDQNDRDRFSQVVEELSDFCFVPLSIGGWVTSCDEINALLRIGADKVIINTAAVRRPVFLAEAAKVFGSQCIVVSIDARCTEVGYEVFIDRGREATGLRPTEWAQQAVAKGAGEIFLTSIDHDGARKGYDLELMRSVVEAVDVPVIAMGGVSTWDHLVDGFREANIDAAACANVLHYTDDSAKKAKRHLREAGIFVR